MPPQIFLRTFDLRMKESPELPYYARLFESPELCCNETPLSCENADKNKIKTCRGNVKTSDLCYKIIFT